MLIHTLLLLLSVAECWAVEPYIPVHPDPVLEPWRWRSFPELKGLGLRCLAEDQDGNMWFGLDEGVRTYNGVKWTAYGSEDGLLGIQVNALCATRDGSVYAGTPRGISRFKDGTWSRVFPPQGDISWDVQDLVEALDGSVWAGTVLGALQITQNEFTLYTTGGARNALRERMPGITFSIVPDEATPTASWGKGGGVLAVRLGSEWFAGVHTHSSTIVDLAPGGPGEAAGLQVGDLILSADGVPLRAGTMTGSAGTSVSLKVQRGENQPFDVTVTLAQVAGVYHSLQVWDVCEGREGRMWFGLRNGKILQGDVGKIQAEGAEAWRLYTEADGLNIGIRPRIVQRQDGTVWTASVGGINRFDGKTWTYVRSGGNGHSSILETRDGTLWVSRGRYGQLSALRNGGWTRYQAPELPIPAVRITGLLEASDGALWMVGVGYEAVRLDLGRDRWTTYERLKFDCETLDGVRWFVSEDAGIARNHGSLWLRYGVEDGLMAYPWRVIQTRKGDIWAVGSHEGAAATARLDGDRWSLQTHPKLAWGITPKAVFESSDGALWFGAVTNLVREKGQLGGVLRFDPSAGSGPVWTHFTPQEGALTWVYGFGQTADGVLWVGSVQGMRCFDGRTWTEIAEPEAFTTSSIDVIYTTPGGDLWVGTRNYGAFHYNGKVWRRHNMQDGLPDNSIRGILQAEDGSTWIESLKGFSRFDGQTWIEDALPAGIERIESALEGILRQGRDGALWINLKAGVPTWYYLGQGDGPSTEGTVSDFHTVRYAPDTLAPETEITLSLKEVSQPGNTTLAWQGMDPWKSTLEGDLQYAYRLDGGSWSPFSKVKSKVLLSLSSGDHIFEVKARDRDFNEDPTPASMTFTVVPPVWQQPWFLGLMAVLLGGIGFQTVRVVRRDRRLQEANIALSSANKDLFGLNKDLQQKTDDLDQSNRELTVEAALERVRAKALGMQQTEDLESVTEMLFVEFYALGFSPWRTGINVRDEDSDRMTTTGFRDGRIRRTSEASLARHDDQFLAITKARLGGMPWSEEKFGGPAAITNFLKKIADVYGFSEDHFEELRQMCPDPTYAYGFFHSRGELIIYVAEPMTEIELAEAKSFADVFDLAYTRFLELKEKEDRARAASRRVAADRVQAEVASMRRVEDLRKVVREILREFLEAGVDFDLCIINIVDEKAGVRRQHGRTPDGWSGRSEMLLSQVSEEFLALWRGKKTLVREVKGELARSISRSRRQLNMPGDVVLPTAVVDAPFAYGTLSLNTQHPDGFSDDDVAFVDDLARVTELGYTRFLDFQLLEMQNEQIQEANRLKSEFLARMSHELRTPMNAIIGFTRMVMRRSADVLPPRQLDNLEKVGLSADHLLNLINEVLDLSRIEANRMDVAVKTFHVQDLVTSCVATVSPLVKPGIKLNNAVPQSIGEATTDDGKLRQIVINLLSNALKFTDEGEVTVSASPGKGIYGEALAVISVADTGMGIPEESLEMIFEEFRQVDGSSTRKHQGTGLGLAITKRLTELLGGRIEVESEVRVGSTFTARVPVVYEEG